MDIVNNFIKIIFINYIIYCVYNKIINNKNNNTYMNIVEIILSILISIIYLASTQSINLLIVLVLILLINIIIIHKITKQDINHVAIIYIIAFAIGYVTYLIALLIAGVLLKLFIPSIDYKTPISLITIPIIQILIIKITFKTRRLKNGLNFLNNINENIKLKKYIILFTSIALLIYVFLQTHNSITINNYIFIGIILLAISLIFWIQHEITEHYKKHMKDRTIEMQKKEIDEQQKIMEEVKQENYHLASVIHKYNHRINAIEKALSKSIQTNENTEFANELAPLLEETKNISQNFTNETTIIQELPKTNIFGIDNMLSYMADEARKHNIHFDLKINDNINYLIENIISQDKFETLLGDHIKDAIIAINTSENQNKSIIVIIGKINNCYELSIYDTGVEFEIDTLLKLGEAPITTHKNEGGTGIGFMTTFATMKDTKSSLIIEEYNQKTTNYTKSITIKFDGKSEYRIYSYRAEQINAKNKNNRIIVKEI